MRKNALSDVRWAISQPVHASRSNTKRMQMGLCVEFNSVAATETKPIRLMVLRVQLNDQNALANPSKWARECMPLVLRTEESSINSMHRQQLRALFLCRFATQPKDHDNKRHGQRSSDRDTKCWRKEQFETRRDKWKTCVFAALGTHTDWAFSTPKPICYMVQCPCRAKWMRAQVNAIKSIWCEVCVFSLVSISFI